MPLVDPITYPHFTQLSRDADSGKTFDDLVFYGFDQPGAGVIIVKNASNEVDWVFVSHAAANLYLNKSGTLWYSPDSGETWHPYDTNVTLYNGSASQDLGYGVFYIGGLVTPDPTDWGSEQDDTFYLKLTINDDPSIEVFTEGFSYHWT